MKSRRLSLFIALLLIFTMVPVKAEPLAREFTFERISGENRYETAVKIANELPDEMKKGVMLVDGGNFADALTAGLYSIQSKHTILLANKNGIPKETMDYIKENKIKEVIILGGVNSVTGQAEAELAALGIKSKRIAGVDRYDTSEKVYAEICKLHNLEGLPEGSFGLVDGLNFADALAAAPYMASNSSNIKGSLLLYKEGSLQDTSALVFGGFSRIPSFPGVLNRYHGDNRYETAVTIANAYNENNGIWQGYNPEEIFIASGENYPDALASAPLINSRKGVLLLTSKNGLEDSTINYIYYSLADKITIIGGKNSVPDKIFEQIRTLNNNPLEEYINTRYNFHIFFNKSLISELTESENGDGVTLKHENFSIKAYASHYLPEHDLLTELNTNEYYKDMLISEVLINGEKRLEAIKSSETGFKQIYTFLEHNIQYSIEIDSKILFENYTRFEQKQIDDLMSSINVIK